MSTIDCNNIRIYTFMTPDEEPLALRADTGAPRSVIGKKHMKRVLDKLGPKSIPAIRGSCVFRVGVVSTKSLCIIELAIQTPDHIPPISILLDAVEVDVPALICLNVLDRSFLMVDNISNRLWQRIVISNDPLDIVNKWCVPLIRDQHHMYVHGQVPTYTFYTTKQFRKLYRQFAHPSPVKLYNLLKRAGNGALYSNTLHQLEKIVAQCDSCQRDKNETDRFRVTLGQEHARFNINVHMDSMHSEGDYVLHLVDEASSFSAARFAGKLDTT